MFDVTSVILVVALVGEGLFVAYYGFGSPWFRSFQGRTMLAKSVLWVLLIVHFLVVGIIGEYPGFEIVKNILLALIATCFWTAFIGLRFAQKETRPTRKHGSGYVTNEQIVATEQGESESEI